MKAAPPAATSAQTNLDYDKRWTLDYPELGTEPVSIEPLISPEYFEREREMVFRRSWLNVGREEQLPQAGDYFVKDIAVCKASIILVRGKEGKIRGFHNVCSHRANKLVWDEAGSCTAFRCKFHGWSYTTAGRLAGVPDEEMFFDFDKSKHGLVEVATQVWQGFIFINLDPSPKETLHEYLGEMGERLSAYPFKDLSTCYAYRGEFRANWKVGVSAFNEGYHLGFVHTQTGGNSLRNKENLFGRPVWIKLYERHHTYSFFGNPDFQMTPVEALAARHGPMMSQGAIGYPPGGNPSGHPYWALDANVLFPNFFIDVFQGSYFTYNFWPLSVDRTFYEMRSYYAPPKNAGERFTQEFSRVWLRELLLEDLQMIEQSQAGIASGARQHLTLQDGEICVRHHMKVVDDHVTRA
jgi:phenylpropionate dioxygenase-like ring-hydroxylating dioxygenase large terminal subunit